MCERVDTEEVRLFAKGAADGTETFMDGLKSFVTIHKEKVCDIVRKWVILTVKDFAGHACLGGMGLYGMD